METKFDEIDLNILKILQDDGRCTNVDLASQVGISAPPCLRRVRALEEIGAIRGYHAEINPTALGFGVTVFAQVGLHSQNDNDLRAFESKVIEWPLVRECYMLTGEADFLLKIVARDWDEYQRFLSTELTTSANIKSVKSKLVVRLSKQLPGIPIEEVKPRRG